MGSFSMSKILTDTTPFNQPMRSIVSHLAFTCLKHTLHMQELWENPTAATDPQHLKHSTLQQYFENIYEDFVLGFQLIEVCFKLCLKSWVLPVFSFICVLVCLVSEMCYLLLEIQVEIVDIRPAPQKMPLKVIKTRPPSRSNTCTNASVTSTSTTTSISSTECAATASRYNQLFVCGLNKCDELPGLIKKGLVSNGGKSQVSSSTLLICKFF